MTSPLAVSWRRVSRRAGGTTLAPRAGPQTAPPPAAGPLVRRRRRRGGGMAVGRSIRPERRRRPQQLTAGADVTPAGCLPSAAQWTRPGGQVRAGADRPPPDGPCARRQRRAAGERPAAPAPAPARERLSAPGGGHGRSSAAGESGGDAVTRNRQWRCSEINRSLGEGQRYQAE